MLIKLLYHTCLFNIVWYCWTIVYRVETSVEVKPLDVPINAKLLLTNALPALLRFLAPIYNLRPLLAPLFAVTLVEPSCEPFLKCLKSVDEVLDEV